jgi:hypothetical protein
MMASLAVIDACEMESTDTYSRRAGWSHNGDIRHRPGTVAVLHHQEGALESASGDAVVVEKTADEIKARYARILRV